MVNEKLNFDFRTFNPLTNKEILELFKQFKNGDLKAREKIIKHNIKLVLNQVLKKFKNIPYDKNDLVSIGFIGLIRAVDNFDINKNINFSTYAVTCINNEIILFLRTLKNFPKEAGIDIVIYGERDSGFDDNPNYKITIEDTLIDEHVHFELDYEHLELIGEIKNQVNLLNEVEKEFVKLYFGFNDKKTKKLEEIASIYHMTSERVRQILKRALDKIKNNLLEQNLIEITDCKRDRLKKAKSLYEYFGEHSKEEIDEILQKLTEKERYIIMNRYIMRKKIRELSNELGVSQSHILTLEKKGLDEIEKTLFFKKN